MSGHECAFEEEGRFCYYGNFAGGDPRCFEPGSIGEDCERNEFDAWVLACESAEKATPARELQPACRHLESESGQVVAHLTMAGFGLGVNHWGPVAWREIAEARKAEAA